MPGQLPETPVLLRVSLWEAYGRAPREKLGHSSVRPWAVGAGFLDPPARSECARPGAAGLRARCAADAYETACPARSMFGASLARNRRATREHRSSGVTRW